MNPKVWTLIEEACEEHNELAEPQHKLNWSGVETPLYGGTNGVLDSLGLVTFLVNIEQKIESHLGVLISLTDDRAVSQNHSPFSNVESLVAFISKLLSQETTS